MSKKFGKPLDGDLWITQNYHVNSSNRAIDISAIQDKPVYAIADGKITITTPNGNSYCCQSVDNSNISLFYVHTYKWLPVGTIVKQGDIICYIAPKTLNGGFPTHLHLGTDLEHCLMDYMDRSLPFRTGYSDIKVDWFNSDGTLNWSLFKDLDYENSTPKFKIGDQIVFIKKENKRAGAGTGFDDIGVYEIGDITTIKDGPRTSQNHQYGKGANDTYTWWDTQPLNSASAWVADMNFFTLYIPPVIEPTPEPTPEPPITPENTDNGSSTINSPVENNPQENTHLDNKQDSIIEIIIDFLTDLISKILKRIGISS